MGKTSERGQAIAMVLVILVVMSILVPAMVFYTQRESRWTAKQAQSTTAFHLAEAGIEKGYLALSLSTQTWTNLQNGTQITGYKSDVAYHDIPGGSYAINITSGPEDEQATVLSIGIEGLHKEVRAVQAVYANSPLGGIAIYSSGGAAINGGVTVEWGAVVSPKDIDMGPSPGPTFPQLWSAGAIRPFITSPSAIKCDSPNCWQWFAYNTNIPANPILDFTFYESSAHATGTWFGTSQASWGNPGNPPYSTSTSKGYTWWVNGNLNISQAVYIVGNVFVTGNFSTTNGGWGNGCSAMNVPRKAWRQYGNNWAHYQPFDTAEPAIFPGLNSSYQSAATLTYTNCPPNKIGINGLLYVGGNVNVGGGGGNSDIYGLLYVVGSSTAASNSAVTLYYNESAAANLQVNQVILSRQSWKNVLDQWPTGLAY